MTRGCAQDDMRRSVGTRPMTASTCGGVQRAREPHVRVRERAHGPALRHHRHQLCHHAGWLVHATALRDLAVSVCASTVSRHLVLQASTCGGARRRERGQPSAHDDEPPQPRTRGCDNGLGCASAQVLLCASAASSPLGFAVCVKINKRVAVARPRYAAAVGRH